MGIDKSALAQRMKLYEKQYSEQRLLNLIPVCARIDGRSFHTWTKGLKRPYDTRLSSLMVATTKYLVDQTNARIGYTQSDEISLVWLTERTDEKLFFDSNLLKMTSILASLATSYFVSRMAFLIPEKADTFPSFDARVWNVPTDYEAANYLLWRELDATRNSITMAAHSVYEHTELHGKNSSEKQELLFKAGINWNDYPSFFKRGTYVQRRSITQAYTAEEIETLPPKHAARTNPDLKVTRNEIQELELPPLKRIVNRTDVIFYGKEPLLREESTVA